MRNILLQQKNSRDFSLKKITGKRKRKRKRKRQGKGRRKGEEIGKEKLKPIFSIF